MRKTSLFFALLLGTSACDADGERDVFEAPLAPGELVEYEIELSMSGSSPKLQTELGMNLRGVWSVEVIDENVRRGCVVSVSSLSWERKIVSELPSPAGGSIAGRCSLFRVDEAGSVVGFAHDEHEEGWMRAAGEVLALELTPPAFSSAADFSRRTDGPSGFGAAQFRFAGEQAGLLRWSKTRANYERAMRLGEPAIFSRGTTAEVASRFELGVAPGGVLVELHGKEELHSAGARREIRLDATAKSRRRATTTLTQVESPAFLAPGEYGLSAEEARNVNIQRAGGHSFKDIKRYLQIMAMGYAPDHRERFSRSLAVLRLTPELATELEQEFDKFGDAGPARPYILDLLANAGTPESEASLIRLLSLAERSASRAALSEYFMRLSFVRHPGEELGAYALGVCDRYSRDTPENTFLALGTLGGSLHRNGKPSGDALIRKLRGLLAEPPPQQHNAAARAVLLRALGNTRREEAIADALPFTTDQRDDLRYAASVALRHGRSEPVLAASRRLLADPNRAVQQAALIAFAHQPRSPEDFKYVGELILEGRVDPFNYADAWTMIRQNVTDRAITGSVAAYMKKDPRTLDYLRKQLD